MCYSRYFERSILGTGRSQRMNGAANKSMEYSRMAGAGLHCNHYRSTVVHGMRVRHNLHVRWSKGSYYQPHETSTLAYRE